LKKIVELECEQSCRKGGGCSAFECEILKCCIEKQYNGCWECEQLNYCNKSDFLKPFHGETPKNNCITLRETGLENFSLLRNSSEHKASLTLARRGSDQLYCPTEQKVGTIPEIPPV